MPPKKDIKKQVPEPPKQELPPPIPPHELQGYGKFEYLDGAVYEGKWKLFNGKKTKHGEGTLKIPGNSHTNLGAEVYEGSWFQDKMQGYGIYRYANGAVFKGQWKQNKQQGRGEYEFPDGTIYDGEWKDHLMHGPGIYIDAKGNKWEGEFREGKFESKLQKQLIKERQLIIKKKQIVKDIELVLQNMIDAISKSDKKTLKQNLSPYFASGEIIKEQVKDITTKLQERPADKWTEVLNILKNDTSKILPLNEATEAQVLQPQRILKPQLEGPGQVVQVIGAVGERNVKAAFVNVEGNHWVLSCFIDDQKKK